MTLYYLPLESIKSRYTNQLCREWMPESLDKSFPEGYVTIDPQVELSEDITVGVVVDAASRVRYSLKQVSTLCEKVASGSITDEDTIFLQDFTTPGIEAFLYTCSVHKVYPHIYAMCHANTFDEYDFTRSFQYWMRGSEQALWKWMTTNGGGIFCASTVHKDLMKEAGVDCPIFVVGLPYSRGAVRRLTRLDNLPRGERDNLVVFSSRLDPEKNPEKMIGIAVEFLKGNPSWEWYVLSSKDVATKDLRLQDLLQQAQNGTDGRFKVLQGLTKMEYYEVLLRASIQFNCSSQDFISWTLLEALDAGCIPVYPEVRSFPELFSGKSRRFLYTPGYVGHCCRTATGTLRDVVCTLSGDNPMSLYHDIPLSVVENCNVGRFLVGSILKQRGLKEVNIWESHNEGIFSLLSSLI